MVLTGFEKILEDQSVKLENVGTFRNGNIDFNCRFFHVIQRTYRRYQYFNNDLAWYYHSLIEAESPVYGVIPICQVIMPTHVHEVYYTRDVRDISNMRAVACGQTTLYMKRKRKKEKQQSVTRLFDRVPRYVAIADREQLLITLKYIYDNDLFLKKEGKLVPYSCFYHWEKQKYKPYAVETVSDLYRIKPEQLVKLLGEDKENVRRFAALYSSEEFRNEDRHVFFKT